MKFKNHQKIFIALIGIAICILILYSLNIYSNKEGFIPSLVPVTYSQATINEYKDYKNKESAETKPKANIEVSTLEKLGVPENSVKQYVSTGSWPWSQGFIKAMKQQMINTPNTTNTSITDSIISTQKIYPEEFMLLWSIFAFQMGFYPTAKSKNLSCNIDPTTNKAIGNSMYTLDKDYKITTTAVDNAQLPTLIPGFNFLSSPCNPCNLFNGNFDCPFAYPDSNGQPLFPGFILEYAWGLSPPPPESSNTISANILPTLPKLF